MGVQNAFTEHALELVLEQVLLLSLPGKKLPQTAADFNLASDLQEKSFLRCDYLLLL